MQKTLYLSNLKELNFCYSHMLFNYQKKAKYLQSQIGNPKGEELPNKKFYDPKVWLRKAEESMSGKLQKMFY